MIKIVTEDPELEKFVMEDEVIKPLPFDFGDMKGAEAFVMSGGPLIAVPIQIMEDERGEITINVYSRFIDAANALADSFPDGLFSDAALEFIKERIEPTMRAAGYEFEDDFDFTTLNFEADDPEKLIKNPSDCVISCFKTNGELSGLEFKSPMDFELDDDSETDFVVAAIRDGVVLSLGSANDYSDDDTIEINVETDPAERCKGYASAVVYELCRRLLELGEKVSYRCYASNAASIRVAEKCGLEKRGKLFSFVCYKY